MKISILFQTEILVTITEFRTINLRKNYMSMNTQTIFKYHVCVFQTENKFLLNGNHTVL